MGKKVECKEIKPGQDPTASDLEDFNVDLSAENTCALRRPEATCWLYD